MTLKRRLKRLNKALGPKSETKTIRVYEDKELGIAYAEDDDGFSFEGTIEEAHRAASSMVGGGLTFLVMLPYSLREGQREEQSLSEDVMQRI